MDSRTTITNVKPVAFTDGEMEVLRLVAEGYTNAKIAQELKKSVRTIETRRSRMMQKAGVNNTALLIRYAVTNQLIT